MGYCALAISSTSCIGPESMSREFTISKINSFLGRHGQNMQTGLFLEFEKTGGVKAVVDVCTFCADLIDNISEMSDEERKKSDKEVMGVAHYFLRHPLIWFYHLACGKPLMESPQTMDIVRFKTQEGFNPAETIIRLRLELLPIFKRFWEAKWLSETSESVRKAIIFGLLAILKGEYEDPTRVPTSHLTMPGLPAIMRRAPQPLSPALIQQLTEMGFPESAARNALNRARGDLAVATEYLLANAHLFDPEDQGNSDAEEMAISRNDVQPAAVPVEEPNAGQEPHAVTAEGTENDERAEVPNVDAVEPEPMATPSRDYAKELADAREELKKSIVPNALRLADANPTFVDDIRDVFVGPAMNANAKFLVQDIKKFSDGAGDIPEIPLQVRCRILALAYLKSGTKGLGLSKEDANELLQSLLALLLAGPIPGTSAEPNIPKWLSSHMLLSDRILCSSENIAPVTLPKDGEPIPKNELLVGPSFEESRAVLFDFCMRLARIPDLHKDDLLSLFGVLSFLTKDYTLAAKFVKNDGLNLVLKYFKIHRQQDDVAAVSMGIFRHLMEDQVTVENLMRQDIKRWSLTPRHRPGESINNYLRSLQHAALRDPQMFIKLTSEMCELVEPTPGISGGYRIRAKAENANLANDEMSPEAAANDSSIHVESPDESAIEIATSVIHHLTSEMMQQYKQSAAEPIAMPTAGLANILPSTATSGMNTPTMEPRLQPLNLADVAITSATTTKEVDYAKFVQSVLCELLLSYEACKTAFLIYPRRKVSGTLLKEVPKVKPSALNFLLQEIMAMKGDTPDLSKRRSRTNPFHSMVVALCSDVTLTTDVKAIPASVINARKTVLDAMVKAMKEASSTVDPNDTAEQRYGRYIALGDLCHMLLTMNPHIVTSQRVHEESLFHMAKLMLEKNVVATLSGMLSEVDLTHPMSSVAASAILAPLETL
jgi:E3 ubiquitin-protein ligase HUWE1